MQISCFSPADITLFETMVSIPPILSINLAKSHMCKAYFIYESECIEVGSRFSLNVPYIRVAF